MLSNSKKGFSSFLKKSKTAENVQDTADNVELEQMAQKRFTILESRDAELRDLLANVRDGAQVGICYDLCPEKERYRRIVQSDIAGFEKENGKVNLGKCMKAYSRSAADQEETLPTELRPAETLRDACWYLCSEICTMDKASFILEGRILLEDLLFYSNTPKSKVFICGLFLIEY